MIIESIKIPYKLKFHGQTLEEIYKYLYNRSGREIDKDILLMKTIVQLCCILLTYTGYMCIPKHDGQAS